MTAKACKRDKDTISILALIMHEYAHSFSTLILNDMQIDCVTEEALANVFAEMCINFYIKNNQEISYLSKKQNIQLQQNGYNKFLIARN